jgi:hypothetical protein
MSYFGNDNNSSFFRTHNEIVIQVCLKPLCSCKHILEQNTEEHPGNGQGIEYGSLKKQLQ